MCLLRLHRRPRKVTRHALRPVQSGTAKALKKGDQLATEFKLKKAQKVADKNTVTLEAEPASKTACFPDCLNAMA